MLRVVRRILKVAGSHSRSLKTAIILAFIEGLFNLGPEFAVMATVYYCVTNKLTTSSVAIIAAALVFSLIMRVVFRRFIDALQCTAGYKMFSDERMKMGEHLKRIAMGHFTDGAIGDVTSIITTDILFIEMYGLKMIDKIINGYVSMILGTIMMLIIDWRIAIIAIFTYIAGNYTLKKIDNLTKSKAKLRQHQMGVLVGAVIEFVQGISVIKAFRLKGKHMKKMDQAFRDTRDYAIDLESQFSRKHVHFYACFCIGIGLIVLTISWLVFNRSMDMSYGLMMLIYSFRFFTPFQALGSTNALTRIMEAGLDRYDKVMNIPQLDKNEQDVKLDKYDIEFNNVTFAYEDTNVLNNITFKMSEKSMTALVGKSGCGKSTITSLIARFWDVQKGEVRVGGVNIKDMSCGSLLENISMVFQKVYLFNDTILNNIKFGKPDATMEEVIVACKKARCYDFILSLEKGFETIVDEGGTSLSGGEKQRISIARAIIKDAPIVLLDEATASIDPDNEKYIQEAISELIKNKTLVVIAHKLRTIKNADQILVIDNGEIIQRGNHESLVTKDGLYRRLWERRSRANSWKINTTKSA